ncbi:MAG: N-acetyltransferase [Paludibacteraceae bacterium]|nr:N-acetyltransferase [Paludibacteraceae bacterium]
MTKIKIVEITDRTKRGLKPFVDFQKKLYKDEPLFIPSMDDDEYNTLIPARNKAFAFCESVYYLAYNEKNEIVGRVAGIINHKANEIWNHKNVRFGWIDFIEDFEVCQALVKAVEDWGRSKGMTQCVGPLGFTDMDKEGLMVDGFDKEGTFTTIWNWPYYPDFLERLGYNKEADWIQDIMYMDDKVPEVLTKFAPIISKRAGVHVVKGLSRNEIAKRYGRDLFHCVNAAFQNLYEYSPMTDEQIDVYVNEYLRVANRDLIAFVVDDKTDRVVGFAFTFPNMSKAYKKANGSFLRGAFHLLRALRHFDTIEMLMIGIVPEYQAKGVTAPMFEYLYSNYVRLGVKKAIVNPRLETNSKVLNLFESFNTEHYMRRRCYKREL